MAPSRPTLELLCIWDHKNKRWQLRAALRARGPATVLVGTRVVDSTIAIDGEVATTLLRAVERELGSLLPY